MSIAQLYQYIRHQLVITGPFWGPVSIVILWLFTSTCAKVLPLEGGPMDTIPPKLMSTYPTQKSTGFKGQELRLIFDKEVQVQDIYNRLIVTPKLPPLAQQGHSYTCKASDKTVIVNLKVPLEEETTYNFNFKDAIQDIREKTPADNPILTFSTGDYVDSMYVSGQVKYLMTDQPASEAVVYLYKITDTDTAHILNTKPDYVGKAGPQGDFRLENLKQGAYRICGGLNKKNESILDASQDPYGFIANPVELNTPLDNLQLAILQANVADFKVQSMLSKEQYFELSCSKPIVKYTLGLAHPYKRFKDPHIYSHLLEDKMTIRIYNTFGLLEDDLIDAKLTAEDEMGNTLDQLVKIQFGSTRGPKTEFKFAIEPPADTQFTPPHFKVDLVFNKPLKTIQPANLYCIVDQADTVQLTMDDLILNPLKDRLTIQKTFDLKAFSTTHAQDTTHTDKGSSITLYIQAEAFISVEKESNKPIHYTYFFKKAAACGTIKGTIKTSAPGFIIQLLDKNFQVIQEIRNQPDYVFKDILPGHYRIRILVLPAKEGVWHFGNINQFEPPDPVIFYPHELAIIANWEVNDIDFEF